MSFQGDPGSGLQVLNELRLEEFIDKGALLDEQSLD